MAEEYSIARIKETVTGESEQVRCEKVAILAVYMATPRVPSQPLGDCVAASEQSRLPARVVCDRRRRLAGGADRECAVEDLRGG